MSNDTTKSAFLKRQNKIEKYVKYPWQPSSLNKSSSPSVLPLSAAAAPNTHASSAEAKHAAHLDGILLSPSSSPPPSSSQTGRRGVKIH
jgi:hypothetical protein